MKHTVANASSGALPGLCVLLNVRSTHDTSPHGDAVNPAIAPLIAAGQQVKDAQVRGCLRCMAWQGGFERGAAEAEGGRAVEGPLPETFSSSWGPARRSLPVVSLPPSGAQLGTAPNDFQHY